MGSAAGHYMWEINTEINTATYITYANSGKCFWLKSGIADTGAIKAVKDN